MAMDMPNEKPESAIFDPSSSFYQNEKLWTYGWICALLTSCSLEENQQPRMIRFEKEMELHVSKCDRKAVDALRDQMLAENKVLPFFILDEIEVKQGERNMAAFRFVGGPVESGAIVDDARSSLYRFVPFEDEKKQAAWDKLEQQYPVVKRIAEGSRGRFASFFVEIVVKHTLENPNCNLPKLLDAAFENVDKRHRRGKDFMAKEVGRNAHLKAISYSHVVSKFQKSVNVTVEVDTEAMHVHFANLMDDQLTEITARDGISNARGEVWTPRCYFPSMEEDLLLYLSILGGKPQSAYSRGYISYYSTWQMFMMYLKGKGFATDEAAGLKRTKTYENAVAHMIFCASRRNGVQGISFDDFFSELLGEFQNAVWMMEMTEGDTKNTIKATDLLDGYNALNISEMKIPFLSPPNAKWPEFILAANTAGCNFGHLTRTSDKVVYVQDSKW